MSAGGGVVNAAAAVQQAFALAADDSGEAVALAATLYPTLVARGRRTLTMELGGAEAPERATLSLYDVLGRRVAVLYDGPPRLGPVALRLPALAAGVYFYRFTGDGLGEGGRIILH